MAFSTVSYKVNKMTKAEYWFVFQNDRLLVKNEGDNKLLSPEDLTTQSFSLIRQHVIATYEGSTYYTAEIASAVELPQEMHLVSLRQALELLGKDWYNMAVRASSIVNWDRNHQYCGRCSAETQHMPNSFERRCPACDLTFYPRISPSVIVLIQRGDDILMARGHHFMPGNYGLIAGFVESGESLEDAVHREVAEEVGIKVKNLVYFGSQPWPFPDSLMVAYTADYAGGELVIDPTEIEAADWYTLDNMPNYNRSSISIARALIDHYVTTQQHKRRKR